MCSEILNDEKINKLYYFINNKFEDPDEKYSELRLYDRSIEKTIALTTLTECMFNIAKDPEDIIFDKCVSYELNLRNLQENNVDFKNNNAIYFCTVAIKVFNVLIDYVKNC